MSNASVKANQGKEQNLANISLNSEVFLQTLCVKLFNQGKEIARAIFDNGSQRSYILDYYAEKMGFEVVGEQRLVHKLFGDSKTSPLLHKGYRISIGNIDGSYSCNIVALSQRKICQ